jgi:hypothetical protein
VANNEEGCLLRGHRKTFNAQRPTLNVQFQHSWRRLCLTWMLGVERWALGV